jgi:hypothetical protein
VGEESDEHDALRAELAERRRKALSEERGDERVEIGPALGDRRRAGSKDRPLLGYPRKVDVHVRRVFAVSWRAKIRV